MKHRCPKNSQKEAELLSTERKRETGEFSGFIFMSKLETSFQKSSK